MSLLRNSLLFCLAGAAFGEPPDDLDRQRLVAHFEMTNSWLADEVNHLSAAQLAFRPSPTSWNVLDCVEHLVLSEREYWALLKTSMAARPIKGESPSEDVDRLWYGIDRTQRSKTIESETPKSRYPGIEPALKDFQSLRATAAGPAARDQPGRLAAITSILKWDQ